MRGDADARGRGRGRKGKWKKSNARAVICRESPPGGRRKATRAAEICARPRPCRTPQPARSGRAWLGYHRNTEILLQSTPFLASIFADVRNARLPCFGAGEWPWRDIKAAPAYCGCKIFLTRPLVPADRATGRVSLRAIQKYCDLHKDTGKKTQEVLSV
jgi:hypothetical protein